MSEPSGTLGDLPEPPIRQQNGVSRAILGRSDELSWRDDPHAAVPPATSRSVFRLPRVRENLPEGTAMTERTHQLDGLSIDLVSVVLQNGQPTLVALTRSQAIAMGYTVLDADPDAMIALLAQQGVVLPVEVAPSGIGPLDSFAKVTPSQPMVGPEIFRDQFRNESVEPIAPEVVDPIVQVNRTVIAQAPSPTPVGNFAVGDATPAVKQASDWGVQPPAILDRNDWSPAAAGWVSSEEFAARLRNESGVDGPASSETTPSANAPVAASTAPVIRRPPQSEPTVVVPLFALEPDEFIAEPSWEVSAPTSEVSAPESELAWADETPDSQAAPDLQPVSDEPVNPTANWPRLAEPVRPHLVLVTSDDDISVPSWSIEVAAPALDEAGEILPIEELAPVAELAPVEERAPVVPLVPLDLVTAARRDSEAALAALSAPAVGVQVPDAKALDAKAPDGQTPDAKAPDTHTPEANTPERPKTEWRETEWRETESRESHRRGTAPTPEQPGSNSISTAVPTISVVGLQRTMAGPLGPVPVLHDISLDLAPGDLVIVSASSGSGATTLLQCLAGFDTPDGGRIFINGEEMGSWSEGDRARFRAASAGFIPQGHELVDDLTARDNVALPLLAAGWSAKPAQAEAQRQLDRFELSERLFFFPSQLSYSERARVAVARALAGDPFVVWADDPTAGLDNDHSGMVIDALVEHHQRGATVVVVSRDERFIVPTARVANLEAGRLGMRALGSLSWSD